MWEALLSDGSVAGGEDNFLEINKPIQKLSIMGPDNTVLHVDDCSQYYLVFHAMAALGQQGKVVGIEVGGLKADGLYHGKHVSRKGLEEKTYTEEEFPYKAGLKPGAL